MAVAIRSNGMHHAVSLGAIEVSSNQQRANNTTAHFDRNYDSEDENMSRRRLRHTSSTELYPRTSVYSKGDIREQYCLTDRQLNSIERPRRSERFFGCLSRRSGTPPSFLGVCVGRRVPSDENLATYAPFYKPPRYSQHQSAYGHEDKLMHTDMDTSYFRRQPASILSTSKITDSGPIVGRTVGVVAADPSSTSGTTKRFEQQNIPADVWLGATAMQENNSSYHCLPQHHPQQMGGTLGPSIASRTKHVSFARSHTLTSFDDAQLGFRSTARMKMARSQERLIGGKKPSVYETVGVGGGSSTMPHLHHSGGMRISTVTPQTQQKQQKAFLASSMHHQHPMILHSHVHAPSGTSGSIANQHDHGHAHLHASLHMHPYLTTDIPTVTYHAELMQTEQPMADLEATKSVAGVLLCPTVTHQIPVAPTPEVVIVEKKFRNAMKTQATQTELRKDGTTAHILALSPRTVHKVRVVSQGAQTNGGIPPKGKKELTKSLSEMPNGNVDIKACLSITDDADSMDFNDHELLHRTQSEEPPRSPLDALQIEGLEGHATIKYYKPPPPLVATNSHTAAMRRSPQTPIAVEKMRRRSTHFPEGDCGHALVMAPPPFDYVSNSLPRRACSYHRTDSEYNSNSLPRNGDRDTAASAVHHDMCKHITECAELLNHAHSTPTIDFTRSHLLPPPQQYCREESDIKQEDVQNNNNNNFEVEHEDINSSAQIEQRHRAHVSTNRRMSMVATMPRQDQSLQEQSKLYNVDINPFRRDDMRRQSMPLYVKTEKLIDGYAPRSSFRSSLRSTIARPKLQSPEHTATLKDEKEIFIDFKPHISQKTSSQQQIKLQRSGPLLFPAPDVKGKQHSNEDEEEECDSCESIEADGGSESVSMVGEEEEEEECDENDHENGDEEEDEDLDDNDEAVAKEAMQADDAEIDDTNGNETYDYDNVDHLYENITATRATGIIPEALNDDYNKRTSEGFWKRSVSLDDAVANEENGREVKPGVSAPPSPYRDELLVNTSTYPSSDSLTNDVTRDHSDGIWNESQVTVLTAGDQKDMSEGSFSSNLLLTPSSKRKNLLLQHQQRSSIDTDALDLEELLTDTNVASTNIPAKMACKVSVKDSKTMSKPLVAPAIAVTPSTNVLASRQDTTYAIISPKPSPCSSRRSSKNYTLPPFEASIKTDLAKVSITNTNGQRLINTDISECSTTNTDEYVTCTDNSKRTPGIKTPPTATSSSSTTQVPVSTQSSQMDKSHGGSSFESASSLYSTRGELLTDEIQPQQDLKMMNIQSCGTIEQQIPKRSPSHSISSTSSGSYNMAGAACLTSQPLTKMKQTKDVSTTTPNTSKVLKPFSEQQPGESQIRPKSKIKPESVSDDERSEMCYSSSGYYESPLEEEQQHQQAAKMRRHVHHRLDEERKKRKSSMKLDIEKENMRALTSPIKRPLTAAAAAVEPTTFIADKMVKKASPERQQIIDRNISDASSTIASVGTVVGATTATSLNKIKRFRPKIRRQFRKSSRDDLLTQRHQNTPGNMYGNTKMINAEKKLLYDDEEEGDGMKEKKDTSPLKFIAKAQTTLSPNLTQQQKDIEMKSKSITSPQTTKSVPDTCQLKAKSVESLRSVSPGSDSVFYSEADGNEVDQKSHCLHCTKDTGDDPHSSVNAAAYGDSMESLPCMEHEIEQDIVKPPSDFADSPITTKTTQRLYKKVDKRFRSEERYHGGERGRHYKNRQENIRAKSEERSRDSTSRNSPRTLRAAGSSPCVLPDTTSEQTQHIIYRGHYDAGRYTRLTDADVWTQLNHQNFDRRDRERDRRASTDSEHSFRSKYQVILHRLVQRRCTLEMYHRQNNNTFRIDKTIVVKSDSGEFGFRIHGSKPVVVAAIEPDTPAECSGLEVGDIIICVNGVQVLDKHHTEVVKIAHDGCEKLELQVARTIGVLMSEDQEPNCQPIYSGFLWRQSGQAKGAPNIKKWVRRWFCLRPDNCLYYYKTENDAQPVGAMIMVKHTVEHCPPDIGRAHAFKVDSGEGIPLYVAADSEELAQRWITLLQQSATQSNTWLDKCSKNLYQQPSSIFKPDCFGYLLKLGSRWCGWSKRYCVLKDACLYFYQDANSRSAFGMACLHGYKVASMSTNAAGKKNAFEIIPPETKLRHYYFSTESEMDKKRWISALEYSIDRWIKSG